MGLALRTEKLKLAMQYNPRCPKFCLITKITLLCVCVCVTTCMGKNGVSMFAHADAYAYLYVQI